MELTPGHVHQAGTRSGLHVVTIWPTPTPGLWHVAAVEKNPQPEIWARFDAIHG